MNLLSETFRFSRPARGSHPLFTKASTDARSVLVVWQLLGPGRAHEVLSLSDGEFLIACLTFRANEAGRAMADLDHQCRANDLTRSEVEIDAAPFGSTAKTCS